jgi:tRNA A37 threonylcarbamoyladenosine modification protein TsaB
MVNKPCELSTIKKQNKEKKLLEREFSELLNVTISVQTRYFRVGIGPGNVWVA